MAEITDDLMEGLENASAATQELAESLSSMAKSMASSSKASDDYRTKSASSFDDLNKTLRTSTDEQEEYSDAVAESKTIWKDMSTTVTKYSKVLEGMTTDILGGPGLSTFKSLIEPISKLMEGLGKILGDVVGGFIQLGGDLPGIGGALDAVGEMAKGAGEALGKISAAAFEFVSNLALDAADQLWSMFQGAASSGLLVTNGMDEMRKQQDALRLSTAEYTTVIKNQRDALATFGGSVAQGAEKLANVAAASEQHRKELLALGWEYTEQAEMQAEFMEDLARSGHLRSMSDQQIADASAEYMKNLSVVSALTGKTADEMKQERDAAMKNMAVQTELSRMDQETRENMQSVIGVLGKELSQTVNETLLFGHTMTDVATMATGAAPIIEQFVNSVKGGMDFDEAFINFRKDLKEGGPQLLENLDSLMNAGRAEMVGYGNQVTSRINESSLGLRNLIKNAELSSEDQVKNTKEAGKQQTETTEDIISLLDTQRKLMNSILNEANKRLPVVTGVLDDLMKKADSLFTDVMKDMGDGGDLDVGGAIQGGMNKIGTVMDDVKESVTSAMDGVNEAMQKTSRMIDGITNSKSWQVMTGQASLGDALFGTDEEIEQKMIADMKSKFGPEAEAANQARLDKMEASPIKTMQEIQALQVKIQRLEMERTDPSMGTRLENDPDYVGPTRAEEISLAETQIQLLEAMLREQRKMRQEQAATN